MEKRGSTIVWGAVRSYSTQFQKIPGRHWHDTVVHFNRQPTQRLIFRQVLDVQITSDDKFQKRFSNMFVRVCVHTIKKKNLCAEIGFDVRLVLGFSSEIDRVSTIVIVFKVFKEKLKTKFDSF